MFSALTKHPKFFALILASFFILMVGVLWFSIHTHHKLVQQNTLEQAELLSNVITQFRTLYTSEVVAKADKLGIKFRHDYKDYADSLPLPATLSMELGEAIGKYNSGASFFLYSKYPFPWRAKTSGLNDAFRAEAWQALLSSPTQPFVRIVETDKGSIMRYATADLMRPSCVQCHNTHPDSPKRDWKEGDVRGVLEVQLPLSVENNNYLEYIRAVSWIITIAISVTFALAIALMLRTRSQTSLLQNRMDELNQNLKRQMQRHEQEFNARQSIARKIESMQRMEALGTLASGIAHDLNNILSPILGYTELSEIKLQRGNNIENELTNIKASVFRAKELIKKILTFGRPELGNRDCVNLVEVTHEVVTLTTSVLHPKTVLDLHCSSLVINVLADRSQLHQILLNLITNADESIAGRGGKIDISLATKVLTAQQEFLANTLEPAEYAVITVKDDGEGISPVIKDRIFEPFFSTKDVGQGHGLGLSAVYNVIENTGGAITVDSIYSLGAEFTIYLPICDPSCTAEPLESIPVIADTDSEDCFPSVLFVDDDPFVCDIVEKILANEDVEHTIESVANKAIMIFKQNPEKFDIVVLDYRMGGITGVEVAKELRAIRPNVPIILVTGYSDEVNENNYRAHGFDGYILKPFSVSAMLETMVQVYQQSKGKS